MTREPAAAEGGPSSEKERQIVETATGLFSRYGYRRTSMELIAKEAGVAKATAYAYFRGKEAVFRAVCEDVARRIEVGAREAVGAEGDVATRVTGALEAKFGLVYDLVTSSPHASEIFESSDRVASEIFEETDVRFRAMLGGVLEAAAERGEVRMRANEVEEAISLLVDAADGVSSAAPDADAHRERLGRLVRVMLAGFGA